MEFLTTYEGFPVPNFYNSADIYKSAPYVGQPKQVVKSELNDANPQEVENLKQAFSKLSMKVSEKGTNSVSSIIKNYKNLIEVLSVNDPEWVKYYKRYGYPDTVSMFDQKPKGFKQMSFKPHFSFEKVEEGLKNNTLFEGTIWKNEWNPDIAYIDVDGLNVDVLIDGVGNQNRAFDRDKVIFELLPSSEW